MRADSIPTCPSSRGRYERIRQRSFEGSVLIEAILVRFCRIEEVCKLIALETYNAESLTERDGYRDTELYNTKEGGRD